MANDKALIVVAAVVGVLLLGQKNQPGGGGIFGDLGGSALPLVTDEDDLGLTQLGDLFSVQGSGEQVPVPVATPVAVVVPAAVAVPVPVATPVPVFPQIDPHSLHQHTDPPVVQTGPLTADEDIGVTPSPDVAVAPETGDIMVEAFPTVDEDDFGVTQLDDLPSGNFTIEDFTVSLSIDEDDFGITQLDDLGEIEAELANELGGATMDFGGGGDGL